MNEGILYALVLIGFLAFIVILNSESSRVEENVRNEIENSLRGKVYYKRYEADISYDSKKHEFTCTYWGGNKQVFKGKYESNVVNDFISFVERETGEEDLWDLYVYRK